MEWQKRGVRKGTALFYCRDNIGCGVTITQPKAPQQNISLNGCPTAENYSKLP
ncbi:hypothetical protein [Microbulbifer sp.]|uniref:hypothetical protein n=1 Tax=Microbulbifer sp. TaxID=1908541 RepID=UPI002F938927